MRQIGTMHQNKVMTGHCLSLIRSKFPRFLPRIKAKTLSSICNVPKDNDKYKKCFSFIKWGIAGYRRGYMKKVSRS